MTKSELINNQEMIQDGINQAVEGILRALHDNEHKTGYHSDTYVSTELWEGQECSIAISENGLLSISVSTKDQRAFLKALRKAVQKDIDEASAKTHELNEKINELDKQIVNVTP